MISKVGIIANPNSGKDIRRLVGYGSVCDNVEKTDIIKRILIGLDAAGVDEILFMPDWYNFSSLAIEGMQKKDADNLKGKVRNIKMSTFGTERDSIVASLIMNEMEVDCIIVLGGDGTSRAAAMGCKDTPLMPISTGTNNVFPYKIEGTIAGFIAGIYSTNNLDKDKVLVKSKHIELYINGELKSIALVDLVIYDDPFIATKALWKPEKIKYVAVTRADIGNLGISSIVWNFKTITRTDRYGLYCYLDKRNPKFTVKALLAPGLVCEVPIRNYSYLNVGERTTIDVESGNDWITVALDGEREFEVNLCKDIIEIELKVGDISILNPEKILEEAVNRGILISRVGDLKNV